MRQAMIERKTKETDIKLKLLMDEFQESRITTGIGFFDHMLKAFSIHSRMALDLECVGDLEVDDHHSIEDVGIVLGKAIQEIFQQNKIIKRFSSVYIPMDEALAFVAIDMSNRSYLVFDAEFEHQSVGEMDTQMVEEFFRALAQHAGMTLHIRLLYGKNDHHKIEAIFKAFAYALKEALSLEDSQVCLSSKGVI